VYDADLLTGRTGFISVAQVLALWRNACRGMPWRASKRCVAIDATRGVSRLGKSNRAGVSNPSHLPTYTQLRLIDRTPTVPFAFYL
jgi:hypothetical protein